MAQSPLPPLDPKVAALLRATAIGVPPVGAKGRVRNQLRLAGVVGAIRYGGASSTVTPTTPEPLRISQNVSRAAVDATTRSWQAIVAGKPALALLAGIAMGAAATLLSPSGPAFRPVPRAQEDIVRSLPSAFLAPALGEEIDRAVPESTPSIAVPRSASSNLKKSGAAETLGQEQRLLAKARAALGRGELDAAMQELDRHAALFPNGSLNEEREALRIVTLAQQGNLATARERAARFRRVYPRSIQMSTVQAAVTGRP